jgi:ABC-2 type transport system ATP-binding protein
MLGVGVSSMLVLEARGVSKSFSGVRVLSGVSLEVGEGEIVGIVGPNGAGKTTLIRILLGLLRRDSGEVRLMGRDPLRDPRAREGVGVVFERPSLPDGMPVAEVLAYAARILGAPGEAVEWAVDAAGLRGHEWKRFSELSAGLKQRAALAHALLARPRLVVADEPTANLDPVERVRILDTIAELSRREGVSFLVTGHVLHEIVRVADRLVVLVSGRVVARGRPDEVARLVGSTASIRASDPEALAGLLEARGFHARVRGLVVEASVDSNLPGLLEALSEAARRGVSIYSVDLVEAGIERLLSG